MRTGRAAPEPTFWHGTCVSSGKEIEFFTMPEEPIMKRFLSRSVLRQENVHFQGRGGRSEENRSAGFRPAFLDAETLTIHESRFGDGHPAPIHVLDGLPEALILTRSPTGRVIAVKGTVVAGFVRDGRFYSRADAARAA